MVLKTTADMVQAPDIFARPRARPVSRAATPAVTPEVAGEAPTRSQAGAKFRARFRVQRSFAKGDLPMFRQQLTKHMPKNVQRFMPPTLLGEGAAPKRAKKKGAKRAAKKKGAKRAAKK